MAPNKTTNSNARPLERGVPSADAADTGAGQRAPYPLTDRGIEAADDPRPTAQFGQPTIVAFDCRTWVPVRGAATKAKTMNDASRIKKIA
jgi:hypothetical protein